MAIEAKVTLLNELERNLADTLTVNQMNAVMSALSDRLADYQLERNDGGPDQPDDLLNAYLSARTVEGRSQGTITQYKYVIGRLMQDVRVSTRDITVYHLRSWLAKEGERGISKRTLDGNRQIFNAYFNWLQRENLITTNPCVNLGKIKYPKVKKTVYSDADIERLKFGCKSLRDRAIVCFLKATACRVSEMTSLNRDDVDLDRQECKVLGKGAKERMVYLDDVAVMTLRDYLDTRQDDLPALFIGKRKNRLKPHGVQQMLRKLGQDTNVYHVHPHKFRRSTATSLIKHGMGIEKVKAILGHDKIDTTMEYVILDQSDIKNSYRKYT